MGRLAGKVAVVTGGGTDIGLAIADRANVPLYSGGSALCGAVNALGRNLAVELARRGIRVNGLSPGLIEGTAIEPNLGGPQLAEFWQDSLRRIPLHRAGSVADTADAALFLATRPHASGQVLEVDGGWTAT